MQISCLLIFRRQSTSYKFKIELLGDLLEPIYDIRAQTKVRRQKFIFDKLAPPEHTFQKMLKITFYSIPAQKTVAEELKTWYFSYCILVDRPMGASYSPPLSGYATGFE